MTTRRRSITKTHERIAQLGWEPSYHQPARRYPTRYRFPNKAKDPMKHIMREYLPMELEKDERVYGGHDAAVRADMPHKAHERWLEILKAFIPVTNFAEIGAGRCMSMLMSAVPNNELRNGYHIQFVDEIRHTGMQMSLARWYAKHVPDPAGWNIGPQALANSVMLSPGLNMLSHFMVGDPIQCAFTLQVVAETAFTNVVFVATPDVAARNGDFTLPTTYLSVQSDEARHISNGYATLLTVLQDDHNAPLIERDLQQAFWINHAFIDVFSAIVIEYFSRDRSDPEPFLDQWVADAIANAPQVIASYAIQGGPGVNIPRHLASVPSSALAAPAVPPMAQLAWASAANPSGGALRLAQVEAQMAADGIDWSADPRPAAKRANRGSW